MISSKYDINNYSKKGSLIIGTQSDLNVGQLLDRYTFESSLLLIKWSTVGVWKGSQLSNLIGTIRVLRDSPLGELEPIDYQLRVSPKKAYIQFLTLNPELPYQLEVFNPDGIAKTNLEIWEFIQPINYLNSNNSMSGTYGNDPIQVNVDNSALAAAIVAGDMATIQAINALPNNMADAAANNAMQTLDPVIASVGASFSNAVASNPNRQAIEVSNRGGTKIKIYTGTTAPATSATFANTGNDVIELVAATGTPGTPGYKAGGTWVATEAQSKSAVWLISSAAGGSVTISQTVTAP
jgi:hypothetical protein